MFNINFDRLFVYTPFDTFITFETNKRELLLLILDHIKFFKHNNYERKR
jgi:hypothetical protein